MIWIVALRPSGSDIVLDGIMSLVEIVKARMELRMRYNPDIRLVTIRLPDGTRREQVADALDQLTDTERSRMYNLPQHKLLRSIADG